MIRKQLFALWIIVYLSACQSLVADEGHTIFVGSELADCYGVTQQKCMLVKRNADDQWEFFYDQIKGFQYQAGYSYQLLVKTTQVEDPAQDASSINYELVEVIQKSCESC